MSDDDLIRRGDAMDAVSMDDPMTAIKIAAIPARGVKPLEWHNLRDGSGHVWPDKWAAECPVFEKTFYAESEEHKAKVEANRAARILAALSPAAQPGADVAAQAREAALLQRAAQLAYEVWDDPAALAKAILALGETRT